MDSDPTVPASASTSASTGEWESVGAHPASHHSAAARRGVAQIARGDRLVDATPESIRELAESAMLLSQGAQRAIEMKREADSACQPCPSTGCGA